MTTFYDIFMVFIYIIAFILLILANPYVSSGMEESDEIDAIKNVYNKYLKGEIFDQIIRFSVIYWILRDIKLSLILTIGLTILQKLITKKKIIKTYKEQKKDSKGRIGLLMASH